MPPIAPASAINPASSGAERRARTSVIAFLPAAETGT
jgi:hypothetical protein